MRRRRRRGERRAKVELFDELLFVETFVCRRAGRGPLGEGARRVALHLLFEAAARAKVEHALLVEAGRGLVRVALVVVAEVSSDQNRRVGRRLVQVCLEADRRRRDGSDRGRLRLHLSSLYHHLLFVLVFVI